MNFHKKGLVILLGCLGFLYMQNFNPENAYAQDNRPSSVYETAERFITALQPFSVKSYATTVGIPTLILNRKGTLGLVGDMTVSILTGSCWKETDQKLFLTLVNRKLKKIFPNCKIYPLTAKCINSSSEVKTACALRTDKKVRCPPPDGLSDITVKIKCILSERINNVFFTEEKFYK